MRYEFPWTCTACGQREPTGASFNQVSDWLTPSDLVHRDRRVCAAYLKRRADELAIKEAELSRRETVLTESKVRGFSNE